MRALIRKEYLRWFLFFMTLLLLSEQLGLYYSILNRIAGLFCLIMYVISCRLLLILMLM